jgi:hypothetical protein
MTGSILCATMTGIESSGFAEFDRLAGLFRRTLSLLDALLQTGDLPEGGSDLLATETLPHIEDVEQGFKGVLRATETDMAELRHLLLRGGFGPPRPRDVPEHRAALIEAMHALRGTGGDRELAPAPRRPLAALEHARLALAMMPRTPEADVHYPGLRRSYADISAPRSPVEFVGRIEEIERTLWWVAAGERPAPRDAAYRRVYGFFDVGERLTGPGLGLS